MKASATRTRRGGLCGGWLTLIGLWLFSPAGACAQVFISEILADPPDDLTGDVNGDGRADRDEDEFVEFHNPESAAVDLSGWVLTGEKSGALFRFPAGALLPSGARAVVFGDDAPEEPFFFAAGGHLGQGLSNRQGALYLIDPAGPDTLARARYSLDRDPDQSICWTADREGLVLHGQWPGRELFSPGKPRPLLQSLIPDPPRLLLAAGESAQLKVVGRYSDGCSRNCTWRSSGAVPPPPSPC